MATWRRGRAGWAAALLGACAVSAAAATKVAVIVPLSGPLAGAGREIEQTTQAWARRANGKGAGVELLVLDDRSSADGARDATRQALAQGAALVLNCFGSVSCVAIAQELKTASVPLIGAIAGDERLRAPDMPHVFTTRGGARDEVDVILKYMKGTSLRDVAVVYQDDGFGQGYKRALDEALKAADLPANVVATVALDPARKDFAAAARAATARPSTGVILLANTVNSLGLIEALNNGGYRGLYFNLAAQANPQFVSRIGELTASNRMVAAFVTMTPNPLLPENGVGAYRELIASHGHGLQPTFLGLESYLNANVTGLVLQKDPKPGADAVARALSALAGTQVAGLTLKYDPARRQATRWVNLSVVTREGRVRSY